MNVLVTGAAGFVGSALVKHLSAKQGIEVTASSRSGDRDFPAGARLHISGDIGVDTNWGEALTGTEVIVHAAARAHVLEDRSVDPMTVFRSVNVDGSLNLARQAAQAGVKRFVFISSIGVVGIQSSKPFTEFDTPDPVEPYAVSKHEAEQGLRAIADETGMEVVIIRPTLVYGPDAPGNFKRLMGLIWKGFPLPLGSIDNRRSFVGLENLVDFIVTCLDHPLAANETFHVADGTDISTPELMLKLGDAMGKPVRLVPFPSWLLKLAASLLGKRTEIDRLCGSLQVSTSKARDLLGWQPPVSLEEGLTQTAAAYTR